MKEIVERILIVLEDSNLDKSGFAEKLDVSPASISHIISGRNNPSLEVILAVLKEFPNVSPDWLLLGQGSKGREQGDMNVLYKETAERIRLLKMILTEHYRSELNLMNELLPKQESK